MTLVIIGLVIFCFFRNQSSGKEYCSSESFKPVCSQNEMISIQKAHYGRKKIGKCINEKHLDEYLMKKPGYINCYSDVRDMIELQCAGKESCDVTVSKINAKTNCNEDFKFYLEAEFSCNRGIALSFLLIDFNLNKKFHTQKMRYYEIKIKT